MQLKLKKVIILAMMAVLTTILAGCAPDLGDFDSDEDYVDYYDNVYLIKEDIETHDISYDTYSFSDFYKSDELNSRDFIPAAGMAMDYYTYMLIEIVHDSDIDQLYLYVSGELGTLNVAVSKITGFLDFSNLRKYDDGPVQIYEEDGQEKQKEYYDPLKEKKAETNVGIIQDRWRSFGFTFYNKHLSESEKYSFSSNDYLIFRFTNNTAYGKDIGLERVKFYANGLFIRTS